ncbi:MAG: RNA-binding protein [Vulcanibacillus sp.]
MSKEGILNHFGKEERSFAARVFDWADGVSKTRVPYITNFVDPRYLEIIVNIVNTYVDLKLFSDGGHSNAERVRVLITNDYITPNYNDLGLIIYEITPENKHTVFQHKEILGAVLNLGVKRDRFGDILISENKQQFIVANDIAEYIRTALNQIGQTNVLLTEINRDSVIAVSNQYHIISTTVSSLRVDSVISSTYNLSRSRVVEMIKKSLVKVNWQMIDQSDVRLKVGDTISIRGYGRSQLIEDQGITKKGRIKIKVRKTT